MLVTLSVGVLLISMLSGLDEVPDWWQQAQGVRPDDPSVVERAVRVENAITTQLTAVRDPENPGWSTKISDEQANAWLGVRLRDTVITHMGEDAWDRRIDRVLLRFDDGAITVGARIRHASGSSIVSARIVLELDEDGILWGDTTALRVGTTRVPSWMVGTRGIQPGRVRLGPGALELGDGRRARLTGIRTRDQWVDVAVETVPANKD